MDGVMNMVVEKLLLSLNQLETAINHAKAGLLCTSSEAAAARMNSYSGICQMQYRLARQLEGLIAKRDYQEVQRVVNLINGLSAMILDDIRVIMNGLPEGERRQSYRC
jgi:hypothetical protein